MGRDFLATSFLCPHCGKLAVADFNTNRTTRKQSFWERDEQVIKCEQCQTALIRNAAYRSNYDRASWKIRFDCPCGMTRHAHTDVCNYFPH